VKIINFGETLFNFRIVAFARFTCFSLFFLIGSMTYAQDWTWANFLDKSVYSSYYHDMVCKGDFVYVTGGFEDSIKLENGSVQISSGHQDFFLVKMDLNGKVMWSKTLGRSSGDDYGKSIDVDNSGNIYVAAITHDTTKASYKTNGLLLKFSPNGDIIFSKEYEGADETNAIKILPSQEILLIGSFFTEVDLGGGNIIYGPPSGSYGRSLFIAKLSSSGDFIWGKMAGGESYTHISANNEIGLDQSGNFYFTGSLRVMFDLPVYFDTIPIDLPGNFTGGSDTYLVKYDAAGDAQWVKRLAGINSAGGTDLHLDAAGDILLAGNFNSSLQFDGNVYNNGKSFLHKYGSDGTLIWGKQIIGCEISHFTTDQNNSIYALASNLSGRDSIYLDGQKINLQNGAKNFLIAKLDPLGNTLSFFETDSSNMNIAATGIAYHNQSLFLIGNYYTAVTLDDIYHLDSTFAYHMGNYVARLSTCSNGNYPQITVTDSTLCNGDSIYLTLNGSDIGDYIWSNKSVGDSLLISQPGSFSVRAIDSQGCTSNISNTLEIYGIEAIKPQIISSGQFEFCQGDTLYLESGMGFKTYDWSNNDTLQHTSFVESALVFVSTVDTNNCKSISDTISITKRPIPSGTDIQVSCSAFTWIDGNTYSSSTDTAVYLLTASSMYGCDSIVNLHLTINKPDTSLTIQDLQILANATNSTFQWLDCDSSFQVISSAVDATFTATKNGNYAVEITQNGCTDTTICIAITTVNTFDLESKFGVIIAPNPSQGSFTVQWPDSEPVDLRITDSQGHLIFEKRNQSTSFLEIELRESIGLYFLELTTQTVYQRHKLVLY